MEPSSGRLKLPLEIPFIDNLVKNKLIFYFGGELSRICIHRLFSFNALFIFVALNQ